MDKRVIMKLHDKAIRLLEGGVVEIQGDWFKLVRLPNEWYVDCCARCDLDSICKREHMDVCVECDEISGGNCCLKLAHT